MARRAGSSSIGPILCAPVLLAFAAACGGEGEILSVNYSAADDATMVFMGPVGEETPLQMSTMFICAGDQLCAPDSVMVTFTPVVPRLCSDTERDWFGSDSLQFGCRDKTAALLMPTGGEVSIRDATLLGERVISEGLLSSSESIIETVAFDLSYDQLREIAEAEGDPELRTNDGTVLIHRGLRFWLHYLISTVKSSAAGNAAT